MYQRYADHETDSEIAEWLRQNGREELGIATGWAGDRRSSAARVLPAALDDESAVTSNGGRGDELVEADAGTEVAQLGARATPGQVLERLGERTSSRNVARRL